MATRSTNTQTEALQRMLGDISQVKTMPDADLQFLVGLETNILGKLREPFEAMQGQIGPTTGPPGAPGGAPVGPSLAGPPPGPAAGGMPPGLMGPGGPGGGAPPMPVSMAPPGGGVPGVMSRPPLPNPDELARMLGKMRKPG
jgi:hypothetical protein